MRQAGILAQGQGANLAHVSHLSHALALITNTLHLACLMLLVQAMKTSIELRASAIASALRANGAKRITQEQANMALKSALADAAPEQIVDVASTFMNLSALNQELERHGLITTERSLPALLAEVKRQLATA